MFDRKSGDIRMGIEGAGPKIMLPAIVVFVVTAWISYAYNLTIPLSSEILTAIGLVLLVPGLLIWVWSMITFLPAYFGDRLATSGPYAVMLNPIYSSWIVLVIPGIALLTGWWLLLLTSVVMYVAMMMSVHTEDDFLRQKFGKKYEEYRQRVVLKFL